MNIIDRFRAWRTQRQARKYFSGLRQSISTGLESGRETTSRWQDQFGWYDGKIRRDKLRSKDVMESLQLIRDLNPDASMAIWNFLRLSNQGHELECVKPSGKPDKQGLDYLNALSKRVGQLYGGGADQLINVLNLVGYTQGAIALEVELNEGLNEIVDFHAVDPSTLDFRTNKETGEIELVQQQWDGTFKVLNREQVYYLPFDPDIGDPYGRSPILPILQIVFFQVEVLKDLKAVAHHQGHARFDISVTEKAIMENIPAEIKMKGPQAVRDFVMDYIKKIEDGFKNLKPDDNFFHPDSVSVQMAGGTNGQSMDATRVIDVINQQVVTALKQLPILLGRNEGTTETHGSIQWQIYVAGIESIQRGVKRILERAYNLALQIKGRQSRAKLTFDKIRTTDRLKEAQAELVETNTKIKQVQQGWIDNDEAANEAVGHDAAGEPQPLQAAGIFRSQSRTLTAKHVPKARADDTEDEFVKEVEAGWASDVAKKTRDAEIAFFDFLQRQKETYQSRVEDAGTPPTRILLELARQRDPSNQRTDSEPSEAFKQWVKVNILHDSEEQISLWDDLGRDWLEQAAVIAGEATLAELTTDIEFDPEDPALLRWLQERSTRDAELIQGTTDEEVIMTLWDVVAEGSYTIEKAADALDDAHGFSHARSRVIARTEMLSAARSGQFQGDVQSGMVIGKTWQSAHDSKTRPAHSEADGQTVRFQETFVVDGEALMFPGDTSHGASADNVIQCRCFYTRILEGEEDKLEELLS